MLTVWERCSSRLKEHVLNALQLVSENVQARSWDIAVPLEGRHFCIFKVTESQCMERPVSLKGKNLSVGHGVSFSPALYYCLFIPVLPFRKASVSAE